MPRKRRRNPKQDFKIASSRRFPDPLAPKEVKDTEEYGLRMAKLIENEWFYIQGSNRYSAFYDNRLKFDKLRRYGRGEQDTTLVKKLITDGTDGESYTNYDFRPIQIVPKSKKIVIDQQVERLYEVDAEAVDGVSQGLRDNFRDILRKNMVSKPMLQDAKNLLNIDLMPTDEIPDSSEEIDLHMRLRYKPNVEVAMEEAIKYTLQLNDYPETQRTCLEDLFDIGVAFVRDQTDPTKGITTEYVDAADMVWSYPERSDFSNCYYYGHVKRMTLSELQRISGKKFTQEELESFKNVSNEWQSYNRISNQFWYRGEDLPSYMIDVLFFEYRTTNKKVIKKKYRKNGSYALIEKDPDFVKTEDIYQKEEEQGYKDFDLLEDMKYIWYKGALVLGSDMLFDYGPCENMVREDGLFNNDVRSSYSGYAPELYQGRIQSLVERVVPTVDQLNQIRIKIQQFIQKAKPNGIWVDVDGLAEMSLGEGQNFGPLDLIRYYDETGNLIGTSRMSDGTYSGSLPVKELNNGGIAGLEQLMGAYNFHLNMYRDFIGLGQGADGSIAAPRTAVAAIEQAQLTSSKATRYILDSQLKITQNLCTNISLRLKDVFKYSRLKEAYINSIGKVNMDVIESLSNLHLHDYGITIKLKPDAQEREILEQNIQAEIAAGGISVTDGIDIRKVGNLTLANEMLKVRKAKNEKKTHERELEKIQQQSDGIVQQTETASKTRLEEIEAEKQKELAVEKQRGTNQLDKIDAEEAANLRLMRAEFGLKFGNDSMLREAEREKQKYAEDRKDKRTAIQATQQSRMKQANEGDAPINFDADFGSMEGELNVDTFRV